MLIDPSATGNEGMVLAGKITPSKMLPAGRSLREYNLARCRKYRWMPDPGKAATRIEDRLAGWTFNNKLQIQVATVL
jgi:hypothetical protein